MQRLSMVTALLCASLFTLDAGAAPPRASGPPKQVKTALTVHWVDTAPSGSRTTHRYVLSLGAHGSSTLEVRGPDRRLEINAKRVGALESNTLELQLSRHLTPPAGTHSSLRAQVVAHVAPGSRARLVHLQGADGTVTDVHVELR